MLETLKRSWTWLVRLFRPRQLTESEVVTAYIAAGACYGDACTYPGGMAPSIGKFSAREAWGVMEKEYAALGYRTIPIKDLIDLGGYGQPVTKLVRISRDIGEEALLWEPSIEGPVPMGPDVLDQLASIGDPRTCPECRTELLEADRVHCTWCLSSILRGSFDNHLAANIAETYLQTE